VPSDALPSDQAAEYARRKRPLNWLDMFFLIIPPPRFFLNSHGEQNDDLSVRRCQLKASTNLEKVKLRLKRKKAFASAGNTQVRKDRPKAAPLISTAPGPLPRSALQGVIVAPPLGNTILRGSASGPTRS